MDKSIIIKIVPFTFLVLFLGAGRADADLYKWVGEDGIVHITDDMGKVPEELRARVKVYKTKKLEKRIEVPERVRIPETVIEKKSREVLYGDHPLEWWKKKFLEIDEEMETLKSGLDSKKRYISVFEGGRRVGQTFGATEVDTYHRYKKEVSQDEETLKGLTDDLKELRRKATIHGVPREVRGE